MRAAIYARASLDAPGEGLSVARQVKACRGIAEQRGWTVVAEHVDNSLSATNTRKVRPEYDAMSAAFARGDLDAVVCWDLDRLTRQPRQLEDWIEAAERRALVVVTANGEADLSTDGGRTYARIKVAIARGEIERKSARQKFAHEQRRERGRPWSPQRSYGFEADNITHHEREAPYVRRLYADLLAGASQAGLARWLNAEGQTTTRLNPWRQATVRQLLLSPRYAGFVTKDRQIVGRAVWEPIVSEEVWRAAVQVVQSRPQPGRRKGLLSGVARCGVCRLLLSTARRDGRRVYECSRHCVQRAADALEQWVVEVALERLARPDARELLVDDTAPDVERLRTEASGLRSRMDVAAAEYAAGALSLPEWRAARDTAARLLAEVEGRMQHTSRTPVLAPLLDGTVGWQGLSVERQRAVLDALFGIAVLPVAKKGRQPFDPAAVRFDWV